MLCTGRKISTAIISIDDSATLAAAYVAGADGLLAIGGAQAVAALAYGVGPVPKCDVIVGPGNKWVTAAKSLVS
eukprot:gene46698-60166_t